MGIFNTKFTPGSWIVVAFGVLYLKFEKKKNKIKEIPQFAIQAMDAMLWCLSSWKLIEIEIHDVKGSRKPVNIYQQDTLHLLSNRTAKKKKNSRLLFRFKCYSFNDSLRRSSPWRRSHSLTEAYPNSLNSLSTIFKGEMKMRHFQFPLQCNCKNLYFFAQFDMSS